MYKILALALFVTMQIGCASLIPYEPSEVCANKSMILDSMNFSNQTASTYNYRCRVPMSSEDKEQLQTVEKAMVPKIEYNSDIRTKKLKNGLWYIALIVPGIISKIGYNKEKSEAINKSQQIKQEASKK